MVTQDFAKQIVDFNKNAVKISFDTVNTFSGQAAKLTDSLFGIVPNVPAEGKKAVDAFFKEQQKGLSSLQKYVESNLDLDWTTAEASTKSLEALEQFCKDAFTPAGDIKKETRGLIEKATEQLPQEAKPLVELWNDAINNGFEDFQNNVTKSFELSKKILADVTVEKTESKAKATSKK